MLLDHTQNKARQDGRMRTGVRGSRQEGDEEKQMGDSYQPAYAGDREVGTQRIY